MLIHLNIKLNSLTPWAPLLASTTLVCLAKKLTTRSQFQNPRLGQTCGRQAIFPKRMLPSEASSLMPRKSRTMASTAPLAPISERAAA